jgi:hypothetical protein
MTKLTLEQVKEGRELEILAWSTFDRESARASLAEWLVEHADALLDAAEQHARGEVAAVTSNGGPIGRSADAEISDALDTLWDVVSGDVKPPGAAGCARSTLERAIVELWYRRGWKGPR